MTHRPYDEDFKKSIVALYQNGKTQSQRSKEYGISLKAYQSRKNMKPAAIADMSAAWYVRDRFISSAPFYHTKIDCFPYESHDKQSLHDKKAVRSCRFPFKYV